MLTVWATTFVELLDKLCEALNSWTKETNIKYIYVGWKLKVGIMVDRKRATIAIKQYTALNTYTTERYIMQEPDVWEPSSLSSIMSNYVNDALHKDDLRSQHFYALNLDTAVTIPGEFLNEHVIHATVPFYFISRYIIEPILSTSKEAYHEFEINGYFIRISPGILILTRGHNDILVSYDGESITSLLETWTNCQNYYSLNWYVKI